MGPEVPPSNKKVGVMFFHKLAVNDANLVTEEWSYGDPATMMGQLGALPKDAPPVRPASDKGIEGAPNVVVTADDPKEKANIELVKKHVDAYNNKKPADAAATVTDDVVLSVQAMDKDITGAKEIEKGMSTFQKAFPDGKVSIDQAYAAGDWVITMGKFTGTNTGDLGKMKKTGKPVAVDYGEVFRIKDGKIAAIYRFYSNMQMMAQLGMMPPPGAPPAAGSAASPGAVPGPGEKPTNPNMKNPAMKPVKAGDACKADADCASLSAEGGKCCDSKCVDCFGAGAGTACCKAKP
jgi:steroid delta-isomerase-like uncharacterized protein